MAHYVFRKGGIPVLASLPHNLTPSPSFLVVRVDETHRRATVELQFNRSVYGLKGEQRISFVYYADNLVPGATMLDRVNVSPPQHLVRQIARHDGRDLRILSLALVKPCTVRWPRIHGELEPSHGSNNRFQQLVDLAKATTLHIVFDYAWLNPAKSAQFLSLIDTSKELVGFPVDTAKLFKEADWTVFSPGEPAPLEAPPTYEDASLKRSRESPTSSPQGPTSKRPLLNPTVESDPGTPTEKATTAAPSSSPRLLPSSPPVRPFVIQDAVETAVAKLLPDALQNVLPDILIRMLTVPTSPPLPSKVTSSPPNPIAPLHNLIRNHLTTHADELAKQITLDTHSHALYLRDTADAELEERLDDQRLEFTVLKEDGLMEMHRLCDAKLEELEEHTAELVGIVEKETGEAYTTVREKLDEFVSEQRMQLVKEMLRIERRRRRGSHPAEPVRRASSVPLEAGW